MSGRLRSLHHQITEKLSRPVDRPQVISAVFWLVFFLVLGTGLFLRIYLSALYGMPYWFPDSPTYVTAALEHPLAPFSEIRTAGLPLLISGALWLAGHPIGIMLAHNLLWLVSTLLLTLAVWRRLGCRTPAMVLLFYLCFVQKNLVFEICLMSEHLSRTMYCLFLAVVFFGLGRPTRRHMVFLALLTLYNVAAKPTAIILVPVTAVFLLISWYLAHQDQNQRGHGLDRWRVARLFGLYLVITGLLLAGYAGVYRQRYGYFSISAFGGFNFYAHVGHLTNLESDLHPEIMAELREFMPIYLEKYAGQDYYMGDWLIFGSVKRECEQQDFGTRNPREVIHRHANRLPGPETIMRKEERIYSDLAFDAIKTHPLSYLAHVMKSIQRLLFEGVTTRYRNPSVTMANHRHGISSWNEVMVKHGRPPPVVNGLLYQNPEERPYLDGVGLIGRYLVSAVTGILEFASPWIFYLALVLLPVLVVQARQQFSVYRTEICLLVVVATLLGTYCVLLGCVLVSSPTRFMLNVQDSFFLIFLIILHSEARALVGLVGRWRRHQSSAAPQSD